MRVLVTGATGFIGKKLGQELVRQGHSVVALVRDVERAKRDLPYPAELVDWKSALPAVDAVVHLAGESIAAKRWCPKQKKLILSSRTDTLRNLSSRLSVTPECFLSASAIGFYGHRGDENLDENSPAGAGFLSEVCQAWEKEAAAVKAGRVLSLRFGMVLGRQGAMEKILPLFRRGLGGRLGNGAQWMSWIHVDDLAQLIIFCLNQKSVSGPVNAVAPEPVRNSEFTSALAHALGKPALCHAPALALKLALGEMSTLLLDSQKVSSKKIEQAGFKFRHAKLESALESLVCKASRKRGTLCHEFLAEQWFPRPVEEVFPFFSEAKNLEAITPPWLNFHITAQSTPRIQEGTTFDYSLKLHGIPMHWRTLILDWKENQMFSDTQQKGPYHFWYHTHKFERLGGGTLMQDCIVYRLPGGFIGDLIAHWKVARDVEAIFAYRRETVYRRFWT